MSGGKPEQLTIVKRALMRAAPLCLLTGSAWFRGKLYDGILLDPPPYGRGPEGEKWVFEEMIVELLETCRSLLSPGAAFLVLSCYAVGTSPLRAGRFSCPSSLCLDGDKRNSDQL